MTSKIQQSIPGVNTLLDCVMARGAAKNDAALSRMLNVAPPVISKLRHGRLELGATLVINIHETTGMSIREIKALVAPTTGVAAA